MFTNQSLDWQNHLLRSASAVNGQRLREEVTHIDCSQFDVLQRAKQKIEHVYFPESGWVSILAMLKDGHSTEVGMIGREGMLGLEAAFGSTTASFEWLVQGPGSMLRMGVEAFQALFAASPPFKDAVFAHALGFQDQVAQTAGCNAHYTVDQRLARWLLMSRDRSDDNALPLTHELLAAMLGVRRTAVSLAAMRLKALGCIDYDPGTVTITDRAKLEQATAGCYQAASRQAGT